MVFSATLPSEAPVWVGRSCELAAGLGAELFVTDPRERIVYANDVFRRRRVFLDLSGAPTFAECYRREVVAGFIGVFPNIDERIDLIKNMRQSPQLTFTRAYSEGTDTCFHERRGEWAVRIGLRSDRAAQFGTFGATGGSVNQIAHAYSVSLRLLTMMDLIAIGIALVDVNGFVLYFNAAMDDLFSRRDGFSIDCYGRIEPSDMEALAAFRAAASFSTRNADSLPRLIPVPRRVGEAPHLVTICHAAPGVSMIQVAPGGGGTRELRHLLAEIGLTAAQSEVAEGLGRGAACGEDERSGGTRRNHIKAVLRTFRAWKIEINGQQGIASLVARLAAVSGKFRR